MGAQVSGNGHIVTSRAYSRALTQLRDIHRPEFDELYAAARVEVADELEVEGLEARHTPAEGPAGVPCGHATHH